MKKEIKYYTEYLPVTLVNKLEMLFKLMRDYRTKDNCLKVVGAIYNMQINKYGDLNCYVPTGREYWRTAIHSGYPVPMKILKDAEVIQTIEILCFNSENPKPGTVRQYYRLNPDLISSTIFRTIRYQHNQKNGVTGEYANQSHSVGFTLEPFSGKKMRLGTVQPDAIKYVEDNAEKMVDSHFNFNVVSSLPQDYTIRYNWFRDGKCFIQRKIAVSNVDSFAKKHGGHFFCYKGDYFFGDIELFKKNRVATIKHHYRRSLLRLSKDDELVNRRSVTTGRIFNPLVNFPSDILHLIRINEKRTIQIDLKTSQFLLFANIINNYISFGTENLMKKFPSGVSRKFVSQLIKVLDLYQDQLPSSGVGIDNDDLIESSSSVTKFIRDVFSGMFYEIAQKECNLINRQIAKSAVFTAIFSKVGNEENVLLARLKNRYPVIMDIIETYKIEYEYNNFPIGLQAVESHLFISKVLKPLRRQGIPCFSRHDSIVVQIGYHDKVEEHMTDIFEKLDFKFNPTIEELRWDGIDNDYSGAVSNWAKEKDMENALSFEEVEDSVEDEYLVLSEKQLEVLYDLEDMGILDDYSDSFVDTRHLQSILLLPGLTKMQFEILEQEVVNYMSGHIRVQPETNQVLREIISNIRY